MYEGQTITEKVWNINYDSGDKEDITKLMTRQKLYTKEHQYNTKANTKLPAQPPTPTAKKNATTKEDRIIDEKDNGHSCCKEEGSYKKSEAAPKTTKMVVKKNKTQQR